MYWHIMLKKKYTWTLVGILLNPGKEMHASMQEELTLRMHDTCCRCQSLQLSRANTTSFNPNQLKGIGNFCLKTKQTKNPLGNGHRSFIHHSKDSKWFINPITRLWITLNTVIRSYIRIVLSNKMEWILYINNSTEKPQVIILSERSQIHIAIL